MMMNFNFPTALLPCNYAWFDLCFLHRFGLAIERIGSVGTGPASYKWDTFFRSFSRIFFRSSPIFKRTNIVGPVYSPKDTDKARLNAQRARLLILLLIQKPFWAAKLTECFS